MLRSYDGRMTVAVQEQAKRRTFSKEPLRVKLGNPNLFQNVRSGMTS